jgi:hypothetical protein
VISLDSAMLADILSSTPGMTTVMPLLLALPAADFRDWLVHSLNVSQLEVGAATTLVWPAFDAP